MPRISENLTFVVFVCVVVTDILLFQTPIYWLESFGEELIAGSLKTYALLPNNF